MRLWLGGYQNVIRFTKYKVHCLHAISKKIISLILSMSSSKLLDTTHSFDYFPLVQCMTIYRWHRSPIIKRIIADICSAWFHHKIFFLSFREWAELAVYLRYCCRMWASHCRDWPTSKCHVNRRRL